MKNSLNVHRTGLALATFIGVIHLIWSIVVAAGLGQIFANFVLRLHFIKPLYVVDPFQFDLAAILIALVVGCGYGFGTLFALIWNWLQR